MLRLKYLEGLDVYGFYMYMYLHPNLSSKRSSEHSLHVLARFVFKSMINKCRPIDWRCGSL